MMEEIPVYLFTGFLDAGKTKFIQETLEDPRFNSGESTLLLLCEEGEEEYEPTTFSGKNVFIETVEEPEELTPLNLERLQKKHAAERVVVEYNGMWMLDQLYQNMPGILDRLPGVSSSPMPRPSWCTTPTCAAWWWTS